VEFGPQINFSNTCAFNIPFAQMLQEFAIVWLRTGPEIKAAISTEHIFWQPHSSTIHYRFHFEIILPFQILLQWIAPLQQ
jgi:hypothetical protein